ncbi:branched-chain amino acid ABC transporter permease [Paralimibaculum aggregatum]|uniref:Branched-chain amino acid ABC transporter permease n=1 Tax=Paralimibaculum aggregatum TaxID=3036245 RepID=A0ABQ6LTK3_9RHOB|nr:branched-chain amino acid ABC transporter permease [Limibaculum sp. NKW23]GMG85393.1 branched-chain amino acid ABC transporter permease [Limibaculum sp. NKW23]
MHGLTRPLLVSLVVLAAALAAVPLLNEYVLYVAMLAALFAILAVSFDVLLGFTGYLSLAHGALFGVGAYCCAYLTARAEVSFWLALPASALLTAVIGALVAVLAFRTRDLYFAVLTLGIGLVGHQLFLVASGITGGIGGFVGIPSMPEIALFGSPSQQKLVVALIGVWITYLAATAFVRSPLGVACQAVREDHVLAQALGIRIAVARLSAFVFGAFFAGAAGALFATFSNFVAPESFAVLAAGFQVVVLVVVGGMGTLWGPILGAVLLTALPESLRVASTYSLLAYGALLLAFIIFAPRGIAGFLIDGARRLRSARAGREPSA